MATTRQKQRALAYGAESEEMVAQRYVAAGYWIAARNWRCAEGELDIVATKGDLVVFCEVKARRSDRFADPATAVDHRKQDRLRKAALRWLAEHGYHARLRFDVVVVVGTRVRLIKDAF